MYRLNLYLDSLNFTNHLVQDEDKIRINMITVPEDNKESFILKSNQMMNIDKSLTINITDKIREILFIFKKTNQLENDQIFASTIVHVTQLPQTFKDKKNNEFQIINIYEPVHYIQPENISIYGHMKIKFTVIKKNEQIESKKDKFMHFYANEETKNLDNDCKVNNRL